ncbi:MAG: Asp-tRNA(Asn)/Glu-tRNA(Gln) amidotransferase subunit GatC [Nitrospiraceae bacterium]|nr:MAG: Asp-tRNA(Asn)/Glu-tRNA(Gln) amidotransferase subunit GatC [Nitrospiraceae bacterium]
MDIGHISLLARLELTEEEKELFSKQVGNIIEYINKLNELDTSGVKPTAHILPVSNVFREDAVTGSLPLEKALQNAPEKDSSFYRVPKIIEET